MTELAELSRIVDALEEKISKQRVFDTEYVETTTREIRGIIEKLTNIEASLYLRRAIRSK